MLIAWKAATCDRRIASFRYRLEAPLTALQQRGHRTELFHPSRRDAYDLVIFSKSYTRADQEIAATLKASGKRVALDICDNHFYNPLDLPKYRDSRGNLLKMIGLADHLICSTPALADVLVREAGLSRPPSVVDDMAELIDLPSRKPAVERASLLWFGSHGSPNAPSGMNDLLRIASHLRDAAAIRPFELVIASNNNEKYQSLAAQLPVPTRYVEWSEEDFPRILAQADAVVIPLSQNPFVACKTHNRITTALGAGIPVVADSIDSYREFQPFCFLDDWQAGLASVLGDAESARDRARPARAYIEEKWTMDRLAPHWEEALGLAPRSAAALRGGMPPAGGHERSYQGALDGKKDEFITGWVRTVSRPDMPVQVTLEADGDVIATALANLPRPDLSAVGFSHSECGFSFAVPDAWRDGVAREFCVVADGCRTLETHTVRFAARPVARVAMPALPDIASVLQSARLVSTDQDSIRLQQLLADELAELNEAVETVRRIAARIVLAAAGGKLEKPVEARQMEIRLPRLIGSEKRSQPN